MTRLGFHRDWYPLIVGVLIVVGFEFALILWTTQGNFTYTLDDPYIHLALAENLARFGHYGLNVEEYSSPSSSILWPFLLVPLLAIGLGASGPLILNVLFAVASVLVIHQIIVDSAKSPSRPAVDVSWVWALLIFFVVNGFGVIFTGMEHSLHILVTAAIIYLINRMQADAGKGVWGAIRLRRFASGVCIVLSPLIRFEGLAISAFAILMLGASGKSRLAIVSVLLTALCLALYFHAMNVLGLPWLPSSVLVKSSAAADIASQGDLLGKLYGVSLNAMDRAVANFMDGEGRLLLLVAAFIAVQAIRMRRAGEKVSSIYVIGVLAVIALHFAFGRFGWYGRYQGYVFIFAIGAALHLFSGSLPPARNLADAAAELCTVGHRGSGDAGLSADVLPADDDAHRRAEHPRATAPDARVRRASLESACCRERYRLCRFSERRICSRPLGFGLGGGSPTEAVRRFRHAAQADGQARRAPGHDLRAGVFRHHPSGLAQGGGPSPEHAANNARVRPGLVFRLRARSGRVFARGEPARRVQAHARTARNAHRRS